MLTATATAMVGVFALSAAGWLDFPKSFPLPAYGVPQIIAGFVFGVGFIIGGYCPGTSVAGIATGRIDAGVYAIGMLTGIFIYAEGFNSFFASWAEATPM